MAILSELCHFFKTNQENSIELWECLVVSNGGFIMTSTKIPNYSIQLPLSHTRPLGIIARKLTVTTSLTSGR